MEIDISEEEEEEFFDLVGCFGSAISLLASQEAIELAGGLEPGSKLGSSVIKRERVPVEEIFGRLDDRWFKSATECRRVCFGNCMRSLSLT